MSYTTLDIYNISFDLFIETHQLSFLLPKYEMYELGSQLRRSSDSVNSNIVEGYGRNHYQGEFVRFLVTSMGSCDETVNHLKKLIRLYPDFADQFTEKMEQYQLLGGKIRNFKTYVENHWNKPITKNK